MKKNHYSLKMEQPKKKIYFNTPQRLTQLIGANTTVIVAGRRTGKTDSIASPFVLRNMQRMPGSTGGIVVPTYKHGLTNTIPGLLAAWKRWGYIKDVHYVIGRKPPKSFGKPIIEPAEYEHVITFYNGSCAIIISQDRPGSSNSLTLSWLLIDEAKFIDYERLKDETLPANGGIKSYFGHHSFNHSVMILSDMPQTQKGSWFLHYQDKMDPDLIETIKGTVYEIWHVKQRIRKMRAEGIEVTRHLRNYLRRLDEQLNKMRSVAVYYKEYSSIENLQLLGESYIKQMKRDLTPKTFQTSILCQRIGIAAMFAQLVHLLSQLIHKLLLKGKHILHLLLCKEVVVRIVGKNLVQSFIHTHQRAEFVGIAQVAPYHPHDVTLRFIQIVYVFEGVFYLFIIIKEEMRTHHIGKCWPMTTMTT